jgi:multisubunit Na+/H+ antiporter MnhE subunit
MSGVGISGIKSFSYLMREDDLKNLRYIWVPNVISGGFFYALIITYFVRDVLVGYQTSFYIEIHSFLLLGSVFFALGTHRFIKTIKSHMESKKKAEASIERIQSELTKRLSPKN